MRVQFVVVGPADHVAIVPLACADLDAEREPVGIEARRKADGWHAEHVDPGGIAMRPITQRAVLRHRLIRGRHLDRGVDEPIQVQAVQFRLVKRHHRAPRPQEVCFRLRIALQRLLRNAALLDCCQ